MACPRFPGGRGCSESELARADARSRQEPSCGAGDGDGSQWTDGHQEDGPQEDHRGGVEEEDPRAELVRRLQEYERFKLAAEELDELPRTGRDFSLAEAWIEDRSIVRDPPEVDLRELLMALKDVMARAELFSSHHIQMEPLSVRERMSMIMQVLDGESYVEFQQLFTTDEGRRGVVVSFIALMELTKEKLVDVVQNEPLGQIYVRGAGEGATAIE